MVLMPAAISHRSTGKEECLRLRVATRELVNLGVDPEKPIVETQFKVRPSEPFARDGNGRQGSENGRTLEHITFWDPQSDVWIERDASALIGTVTSGSRPVKKIRGFDYFTGMTGKGGAKAPVLYHGKEFRIDVTIWKKSKGAFIEVATRTRFGFSFAAIRSTIRNGAPWSWTPGRLR